MAENWKNCFEEELICPICLHVFVEPVQLPCKHNFCRGCIGEAWAKDSGLVRCPECNQAYNQKPGLEKNLKLTNIVEKFNALHVEKPPAALHCVFCRRGPPLPAQKVCLRCEAPCCQSHVQTHLQQPSTARGHLLVEADDVRAWSCPQHNAYRLYHCEAEQVAVCQYCCYYSGAHQGHSVCDVEIRRNEIRKMLMKQQDRLEEREQDIEDQLYKLESDKRLVEEKVSQLKEEVRKMAAPLPRSLSCLSRAVGWWSRQPILMTQSTAVVPVRTKKRFTPPIYQPKYKTEKEFTEYARKAGLVIPQESLERPIHLACTASIFDAYVPPEGDARVSSLSKEGLAQRTERLKKNVASQLSIRRIKESDPNFKVKDFPEKAQDIFIEAHLCLNNSDHDRLHTLVTENCFPDMVWDIKYKTVRWSFVESLEPPQVVQVRCSSLVTKSNAYGQVTVRMHTRQTLAIYDRFGRLMYGQEDVPRDVLEYVVFEKHLANPYGSWRMHGKIVPPWAPPKQPILKTVMIPGPQLKPGEEYEELQREAHKPQLA